MKARLLINNDSIQLLVCNGKIIIFTTDEAQKFLLNFDSPTYYEGNGTWNNEYITMEDYSGETVAIVTDENTLHVTNSKQFREIFKDQTTKFLTVAEYAELHGKQPAIVRRFCQNNRLPGVVSKGKTWLIPQDTPYPTDNRRKKQQVNEAK